MAAGNNQKPVTLEKGAEMGKEIYVGNLAFSTDEDALREAFTQFGAVEKVSVITDRETGRSKGFAFVTMVEDEQAKTAIAGLDGKEIEGRTIKVNLARAKDDSHGKRPSGGRNSYGGGGRNRY
jgi:cold-inducible RNA-binding protein